VTKAIEKVDGVTAVSVNLDTKTATVTFDNDLTTDVLIAAASTNVGYPASVIETETQ
jgi:mercuric ion binding protein